MTALAISDQGANRPSDKAMEQKRKIVIPLGGSSRGAGAAPSGFDGEQTVPAPLFDAEATLGAQPVVPLAEATAPGGTNRLPLIALLIVIAVGAGVAGGFAIGVYKSRQNKQAETATNATTTTTAATTASSGAATQPSAQIPVLASEKSSEPPARTVATDDTTERNSSSSARDKKSRTDDEQVIPPVEIRERSSSGKERREAKSERSGGGIKDDDGDERVARKQRKEQRRRAREADAHDADLNRQVERAGQEVNRIREIFEGQRP
jgi:type II secretory pathway pseudopilin PulG